MGCAYNGHRPIVFADRRRRSVKRGAVLNGSGRRFASRRRLNSTQLNVAHTTSLYMPQYTSLSHYLTPRQLNKELIQKPARSITNTLVRMLFI